MQENFDWLVLATMPKINHKITQLILQLENLATLKDLSISEMESFGFSRSQANYIKHPDLKKIEQHLKWAEQAGNNLICYGSDKYPALLKEIHTPPLVLFVKGNYQLLKQSQIAIVGSRNASISGKNIARTLAYKLVENRQIITSGLALGIDSAAHRGAVANNGKTIAILATGIDKTYPRSHTILASEILEKNGALVTEFFIEQTVHKHHFIRRNRIISGLSQGVVVVEAQIKSGSLITARYAMEQNREVWAVPGNIYNPQTKGCHYLIKQGATLIEDEKDILLSLEIPHNRVK